MLRYVPTFLPIEFEWALSFVDCSTLAQAAPTSGDRSAAWASEAAGGWLSPWPCLPRHGRPRPHGPCCGSCRPMESCPDRYLAADAHPPPPGNLLPSLPPAASRRDRCLVTWLGLSAKQAAAHTGKTRRRRWLMFTLFSVRNAVTALADPGGGGKGIATVLIWGGLRHANPTNPKI